MDFSKIDLSQNQDLARLIILEASKRDFKDRRAFQKFRNTLVKKSGGVIFHNLYFIKAYRDLIAEGEMIDKPSLLKLIQKRSVRTMSGVAPVTVLTKPFPCPGRCVYCPTDIRMPKSYLASQPAAQRGFRQQFDPYSQVFVRLKALMMTGHEISKVELRILGGTWSAYPDDYKESFVKKCLLAMNEFYDQISDGVGDRIQDVTKKLIVNGDEISTVILNPLVNEGDLTFSDVVEKNETAKVRCIGINIETRPDCVSQDEVVKLRYLGVTKVEMGVQTTDDKVQALTKRGHDLNSVRKATALLKNAGFKIGYHMMPNLPGASIEGDKNMVADLFTKSDYQPDYLKIYPCMVLPGTELEKMYEKGDYESYSDEVLEEVLYEEMKSVPEWCRVDRVARDIPSDEIASGSKKSNIRQVLEKRMKDEGFRCRDIRAREIYDGELDEKNVELVLREYEASGGRELFLSYEDVVQDKLIALLRLRLPDSVIIDELKDAALIREVHVYGKQIAVGDKHGGIKQHFGWGGKLMKVAEELAVKNGFSKVAVISGIGTREYYRKKDYELEGTYMLKDV